MGKRVVILASGAGSNAGNIIRHLRNVNGADVVAICSNNRSAGVLNIAAEEDVESFVFSKYELEETDVLDQFLAKKNPDLIVLAGFLLKFPARLINEYPNKVINLHPALLPKFGGKGMYGINVHRAVVEAKEKETGITIHYVNENYDEGAVIAQFSSAVLEGETAENIQDKIKRLEQNYFPKTVEKIIFK
jgi:phosphoribosylglycinamide formyltransferase-1